MSDAPSSALGEHVGDASPYTSASSPPASEPALSDSDSSEPLSAWHARTHAAPPPTPVPLTGAEPLEQPGQALLRHHTARLRYNALYLRHRKDAFRLRRTRAPRDWQWWRTWTREERALFFRALARHSRLRPDLIAHTIGTRTTVEVCDVIHRFDSYVRRLSALGEARGAMLARMPAAHEMSARWLMVEETCARDSADMDEVVAAGCRAPTDPLVAGTPADELHNFCQFLTPGCAMSGTPRAEPVAHVYARLSTLRTRMVAYTPAYYDLVLQYPLPRIRTQNEFFHLVLRAPCYTVLDAQGRPTTLRGVMKMSSRARLQLYMHYKVQPDAPPARFVPPREPEPLIDWRHLPPLTPAAVRALSAQLRAFVCRVMYELVVLHDRTKTKELAVAPRAVWAVLALLGHARPSTRAAHALEMDDRALDVAAAARMRHDPPLLFRPACAPGTGATEIEPDGVSSASESEHTPEPPDDTRIGATRTLVPAEHVQVYPTPASGLDGGAWRPRTADAADDAAADSAVETADAHGDARHELWMYGWMCGATKDASR